MSISYLTQGYYIASMYSDIIFQILLSCSRLMTLHHVTCHVTAVLHASSLSKKKKKKKKRNIKSKNLNKRKRKLLVFKVFHNNFSCPCGLYLIESRRHILHKYRRFNEYWNLRRDLISYFIMFLKLNLNVFVFINTIT